MMYQNFVHARTLQPKNPFCKYLKQAAMLSISLAAFCSYGSCSDAAEDADNTLIRRVSSRDSLKSASEADIEISRKDIMISKIEKALRMQNTSLNPQFRQNIKQGLYLINLGISVPNQELAHLASMEDIVKSASSTDDKASLHAIRDAAYQAHLWVIDNQANISWNGIPLFVGDLTKERSTRLSNSTIPDLGTSTDLSRDVAKIQAGAATLPGIYGLSYNYNPDTVNVEYTLSKDGLDIAKKKYPANSVVGPRPIVFDNGLTIITADNTDETNPLLGVEFIKVSPKDPVVMDVHVGERITDKITLVFPETDTLSLNLSGTNLLDSKSRTFAKPKIDAAREQLNSILASLDDQKSQLLAKLTELGEPPIKEEEMALPQEKASFDITEIDRYRASIVPNVQQELDKIIAETAANSLPGDLITNAHGTVAFLASMSHLISEQLQSMKKLGICANADTISHQQCEKLNEAIQLHKSSIDLIANTSWNDVSSMADRSMDVQVGQHSISITLSNLTVEALGLGDLNISDKYLAIEACNKIDETIIQIGHGIAALGGQMVRLRCATEIDATTDTTDYLSIMSNTIYAAKARTYQSSTDTISPSQKAKLNLDYKAHLDCINMLETTSNMVKGEFAYSVASLRGNGESSLYDLLKDTNISDKHSAGLTIERLVAAANQYRAQLERLLAGLSAVN